MAVYTNECASASGVIKRTYRHIIPRPQSVRSRFHSRFLTPLVRPCLHGDCKSHICVCYCYLRYTFLTSTKERYEWTLRCGVQHAGVLYSQLHSASPLVGQLICFKRCDTSYHAPTVDGATVCISSDFHQRLQWTTQNHTAQQNMHGQSRITSTESSARVPCRSVCCLPGIRCSRRRCLEWTFQIYCAALQCKWTTTNR